MVSEHVFYRFITSFQQQQQSNSKESNDHFMNIFEHSDVAGSDKEAMMRSTMHYFFDAVTIVLQARTTLSLST